MCLTRCFSWRSSSMEFMKRLGRVGRYFSLPLNASGHRVLQFCLSPTSYRAAEHPNPSLLNSASRVLWFLVFLCFSLSLFSWSFFVFSSGDFLILAIVVLSSRTSVIFFFFCYCTVFNCCFKVFLCYSVDTKWACLTVCFFLGYQWQLHCYAFTRVIYVCVCIYVWVCIHIYTYFLKSVLPGTVYIGNMLFPLD